MTVQAEFARTVPSVRPGEFAFAPPATASRMPWMCAFAFCAAFGFTACAIFGQAAKTVAAADPKREVARAAVLVAQEAVSKLDAECARLSRLKHDALLAHKCDEAYMHARPAVIGAAQLVDAWDAIEFKDALCAISRAAAAVDDFASIFHAEGGTVPDVAADARKLASALGGCHE